MNRLISLILAALLLAPFALRANDAALSPRPIPPALQLEWPELEVFAPIQEASI